MTDIARVLQTERVDKGELLRYVLALEEQLHLLLLARAEVVQKIVDEVVLLLALRDVRDGGVGGGEKRREFSDVASARAELKLLPDAGESDVFRPAAVRRGGSVFESRLMVERIAEVLPIAAEEIRLEVDHPEGRVGAALGGERDQAGAGIAVR